MAKILPFKAMRPAAEFADRIAALPYDVYNRAEAKVEVTKEPLSFLAIDRAETLLSDDTDTYAEIVYETAAKRLNEMFADGKFIEDNDKHYYIYELTMDGRSQTGIVAVASVDDYDTGIIKKHENTREEKELDRIHHVDSLSAQTGPIFLAYRKNETISAVIAETKKSAPLYDFVSPDGIGHRCWIIEKDNDKITAAFDGINDIYIADGHHRCASAVKVSKRRREANPSYTGNEEFNYFLSVLFPDEELKILDYNRVVKDLNGYSEEELLAELENSFSINKSESQVRPAKKGEFGLYLKDSGWYTLNLKPEFMSDDPVDGLDVSLLQQYMLEPVLSIKDPRTDSRIDFVGGIRGLSELERRCTIDCALAVSMYPTSIDELFSVADANRLMPPKSTWFEPKLRSGLFIHRIEK